MDILKINIKSFLQRYEIKPKKKYGQNFIFEKNLLNKIVDSIEPIKKFLIIEIGPGPGGLTNILLERSPKNLLLIEKDIAFKNLLTDLTKKYTTTNTKMIFEDILSINLLKLDFVKKNKVKFISNLPYYISTKILMKILPFENNFEEAVFMFQKEVAERILSDPHSKNYSKLSVIVQYCCEVKKITNIKSNVFFPKPEVDGCVLSFKPKKGVNKKQFLVVKKITKLAFEKRRKTLKNSLSSIDHIVKLLNTLKINSELRAENLTVLQYKKLASLIEKDN